MVILGQNSHVMAPRIFSIEGLITLREFDFDQITRHPSEDLCKDFSRLESARLQITIKYGLDDEIHNAKDLLRRLKGNGTANKRKGWVKAEVGGRKPEF